MWEQMEAVVTQAPSGYPDLIERVATAALVPELDAYLVAAWPETIGPSDIQSPTTAYLYRAKDGRYMGEWKIGPGIEIQHIGVLIGADGQRTLVVLGSEGAAISPQARGTGGFIWTLASLKSGLWRDNDEVPDYLFQGTAMGYEENTRLNVDRVEAIIEEVQTDDKAAVLEISATSIYLAGVGLTTVLSATPRNAAGGVLSHAADVTWETDDAGVATVVSTGSETAIVTEVALGTTAIRARLNPDSGFALTSEDCTVHCVAKTIATGGTVTDVPDGGDLPDGTTADGPTRVHVFTEDGTFVVSSAGGSPLTVVVVGGGGGGGGSGDIDGGSGGGGGGVQTTNPDPSVGSIDVVVGAGGAGGSGVDGDAGEDSSFDTTVSRGGHGGAGGTFGLRLGGTSGAPTEHGGGAPAGKSSGPAIIGLGGGGGGAGGNGGNAVVATEGVIGNGGAGGAALGIFGGGGGGGAYSTGGGMGTPGTSPGGYGNGGQGGHVSGSPGTQGVVIVYYQHPT